MNKFKLVAPFSPDGDQPHAIKQLSAGLRKKFKKIQTLLGVTGSGKSLDYDEFILILDPNGFIKKTTIGDFVEFNLNNPKTINDTLYQKISGTKILSFDNNYTVSAKEILEVSKHKEDYVYEVVLDDNSSIKVTKDHNCFKLDNCNLKLCKTNDLKIGDYLPLSNGIYTPSKPIKSINLLDYNSNYKLGISDFLKKQKITKEQFYKIYKNKINAPNWKYNQIINETKERGVSLKEFQIILDFLNIKLKDISDQIYIITDKEHKIKPIIDITPEFLIFLGMFVSEGCLSDKYVIITNENRKIQENCIAFANKLGINYCIRDKLNIQYSSIILRNLMQSFGKGAYNKKFTDFIYNLSNDNLAIVLRSAYDGDGWVEDGGIYYCSASKELIYDIRNLLLRFGITSRIRIKKIGPNAKYAGNIYYQLNITGKQNIINYQKRISFSIDYKKEKLNKIIKINDNTNVDLFPNASNFIKKIRLDYNLFQKDLAAIAKCNRSMISMMESNKRQPSKKLMKNIIKWLIKKDNKYSQISNLLNFNYRKIKSIKKIKSKTGFVYDISIKDNENFMAGFGNIFVHNTFTLSHVIANYNRPTLVLAHNKTLAAQLYNELKDFFPENKVEYFVSYYDYYQPESYIPQKDLYIEKNTKINDKIEQMRLSATTSLVSRSDVIVVASVSCIYGLGNPKTFREKGFTIEKGQKLKRTELLRQLIDIQFERNDIELMPGRFRVKGDVVDISPGYTQNFIRIELFGETVDRITEMDKITNVKISDFDKFFIHPAKQFVITKESVDPAIASIREELESRVMDLEPLEAHRLKQRTMYDLEMIKETGYCNGIENYSRHFDGRKPGERPFCLLDYFPDDFLLVIDESHQTIPQLHGMYAGDYSRKKTLIDYGFRLPSAFDNRPLKFKEFEKFMDTVIFVSATPSEFETKLSSQVVEQIIRPTGLVDPPVFIKPSKNQIEDLTFNIRKTIAKGNRCLVTALTKKLAEELAEYLSGQGIKTRYLHSEINTLERTEIIRELRLGKFDCLVGINLLREGIDIPEVSFIGIIDADKEGFLRDQRSLIQIIGRAARNSESYVHLYADKMTESIKGAVKETARRRQIQLDYNLQYGITPKTIIKPIREKEIDEITDVIHIPKPEIPNLIIELEKQMVEASDKLDFETAIRLRDKVKELKKRIN